MLVLRAQKLMPGEAISIRKANGDDVSAILDCLREAFEPYSESYTPDAYRDTVSTPEDLRQRLATMCVFVAAIPALSHATLSIQTKATSAGWQCERHGMAPG